MPEAVMEARPASSQAAAVKGAPVTEKSQRFVSIDAYRGFIMPLLVAVDAAMKPPRSIVLRNAAEHSLLHGHCIGPSLRRQIRMPAPILPGAVKQPRIVSQVPRHEVNQAGLLPDVTVRNHTIATFD